MAHRLTLPQVRRRAMAAQGLGDPLDDVVSATSASAGIYGSAPTSHFSLAARVEGYVQADLEHALVDDRSLLRVPAMRSSVYLLSPATAWHGIALLGERNRSWFLKILEMDIDVYERLVGRIEDILAEHPLTASDIRRRLGDDAPEGPRLGYALRQMGNEARIVKTATRGGIRSQRFEYALVRTWVDAPATLPSPEEALEVLAPIWLRAHGPATVEDLAWWSGTSRAQAVAAIEALDVVPTRVDGIDGDLFITEEGLTIPTDERIGVRLLPVWDVYLMAHKDRARYLDEQWRGCVVDKNGNVASTIVRDGVVVGVWDLDGETLRYGTFPGTQVHQAAIAEAAGRFSGIATVEGVREVAPQPLARRGQNAFQAPLKHLD